jgi:hypothetical protein
VEVEVEVEVEVDRDRDGDGMERAQGYLLSDPKNIHSRSALIDPGY